MTWKEYKKKIKLINKYGITKAELKESCKRYEDIKKACVALSKCSLSTSQAMENLRINIQYMKMASFVNQNKEVLIEDYIRQSNLKRHDNTLGR